MRTKFGNSCLASEDTDAFQRPFTLNQRVKSGSAGLAAVDKLTRHYGKCRRGNYNRFTRKSSPTAVRLARAIVIGKKNHQAVSKGLGRRESETSRLPRGARRERRRGWRRREEIHYHKAENFTRIMPESSESPAGYPAVMLVVIKIPSQWPHINSLTPRVFSRTFRCTARFR